MNTEFPLRIVLENPTVDVTYGLQEGKGSNYKTIQTQKGNGKNLLFNFKVKFKIIDGRQPVFLGPFVQGTGNERFVYIDIGTFAGQQDSIWSRRLKIPLTGITLKMIQQSLSDPSVLIEAVVSGTGKGGGPNCGTVKPFNGWKLKHLQEGI